MAGAIESALVVRVPQAEPVVGNLRSLYDPAATWGVPAHITVLYPWLPPADIDSASVAEVASLAAEFAAFDFRLDAVDQFDTRVLYVAPNPAEPFQELTAAVARRWPDHPPYGGVHDEVIPHLTVAHTGRGASFDAIRARIKADLPVYSRAEEIDLMVGSYQPGSWHTVYTFPLGEGGAPEPVAGLPITTS